MASMDGFHEGTWVEADEPDGLVWECSAECPACTVMNERTRYLMIDSLGGRHWLTETGCAQALNGAWGDGGVALDLDTFIERPLTEDEKRRITFLSHDLSAAK